MAKCTNFGWGDGVWRGVFCDFAVGSLEKYQYFAGGLVLFEDFRGQKYHAILLLFWQGEKYQLIAWELVLFEGFRGQKYQAVLAGSRRWYFWID